MDYRTYEVCEELSPLVKCFWSLEAPASDITEKQRIVPDGCMELIFHYGDLYCQFREDGSSFEQPRAFVFGQITTPLEIAATGKTGILAARFYPDGFDPLATIPIRDMENTAVSLEKLFGKEGIELEEKVLAAADNTVRIQLIEAFLLGRLQSSEAIDRVSRSCVEVLLQLKGQISVDELSDQLNVNRRQLERKLSAAIGLSPKQLSKIIRLQATLKMLENGQFTNLTELAYENGYFDQAHFIKDFKEFTGMSPKQFYADNLKMTTLFLMERE
ncbi:MAG: transcriptional regulator, AraC family [Crocinitomicaceae bacterium]|jgi:AraC-like DNA-binding protein|nr:transcriptional regulator, AraC family [Crocinitomicaceae bacterium]